MATTKFLKWKAAAPSRMVEVAAARVVIGSDPGDLNDNDLLITTADTAASVSEQLSWMIEYSRVMMLMEVVGR